MKEVILNVAKKLAIACCICMIAMGTVVVPEAYACTLTSFTDRCEDTLAPGQSTVVDTAPVSGADVPIVVDNRNTSSSVNLSITSAGNFFPINVGPFGVSNNTISNVGNDITITSNSNNSSRVGFCLGRC